MPLGSIAYERSNSLVSCATASRESGVSHAHRRLDDGVSGAPAIERSRLCWGNGQNGARPTQPRLSLGCLWEAGALRAENESDGANPRNDVVTELKVPLRQPPLHLLVAAVAAPAETFSGAEARSDQKVLMGSTLKTNGY